MSRRTDPRVVRTERAVVEAARRVIASAGLAGVTYEAVAAEASVSRTTLYRYWPTLDDLIGAALFGLAADNPQPPVTDELADDVATIFTRLLVALDDPFTGSAIASLIDAAEREPARGAMLAALVEQRRMSALDRLHTARVTRRDAEVIVDLIAGALYYRRYIRRVDTTPADLARLVRHVPLTSQAAPQRRSS